MMIEITSRKAVVIKLISLWTVALTIESMEEVRSDSDLGGVK